MYLNEEFQTISSLCSNCYFYCCGVDDWGIKIEVVVAAREFIYIISNIKAKLKKDHLHLVEQS